MLNAAQELRRSYAAVLNVGDSKIVSLGAEDAENIELVDEGNANYVLATTTSKNRISVQWEGFARGAAWAISTSDGSRKKVAENIRGFFSASPKGNYISWYDWKTRNYFTYNVTNGVTNNISKSIKQPLWDEEDDHPDDPPPHGVAGWVENDKAILLYDKYDIWRVDPDGKQLPINLSQSIGRSAKTEIRYQRTDPEERFIKEGQPLLLRAFNRVTKYDGFYSAIYGNNQKPSFITSLPNAFLGIVKAKKS